MKRSEKILTEVRSWPEEVRKLLAVFSLMIAAVLIFIGWSAFTSARLGELINSPAPPVISRDKQKFFSPETRAPGPVAGISDVLKSAFSFVGGGAEGLWKYIYEPLR